MIDKEPLEAALDAVKTAFPNAKPKLGMILGSGLSEVAAAFEKLGDISYADIPGLGAAVDVLTTVFTLDSGESSSEVFEIADRRILIQVLERSGPSDEILTNERSGRRERALI